MIGISASLCVTASLCLVASFDTPQELLPYENSVCRVRVRCLNGETAYGSGMLFAVPVGFTEKRYVLTAYHVIADQTLIHITWDGLEYYRADVVCARPSCDSVILEVSNVSANGCLFPINLLRVPIAESDVRSGEVVYCFGFGPTRREEGANTLQVSSGVMVALLSNEFNDPVWFAIQASNRNGDSGGPACVIRNGRVYLIGSVWGGGYDPSRRIVTTTGSRLTVLNRMFGKDSIPARRASQSRESNVVHNSDFAGFVGSGLDKL